MNNKPEQKSRDILTDREKALADELAFSMRDALHSIAYGLVEDVKRETFHPDFETRRLDNEC